MDRLRHSVEVIRRGQAASGAFLASPQFQTYRYTWLRDGTFVAYAMDVAGEHAEAVEYLAEYLAEYLVEFFGEPCHDCWEKFGDRVHPSTLGAVYGGLSAVAGLWRSEPASGRTPSGGLTIWG